MQHPLIISATLSAALCGTAIAADSGAIAFPDGYRSWQHHHSTLNQTGHNPEGSVGMQHVYADPLAVEGLKTGQYATGATFVVDRFNYEVDGNHSASQTTRKVVAVMRYDATRYADTGGWGFAAFKGGDPAQQVIDTPEKAKACFSCHAPLAADHFLFTKGMP